MPPSPGVEGNFGPGMKGLFRFGWLFIWFACIRFGVVEFPWLREGTLKEGETEKSDVFGT